MTTDMLAAGLDLCLVAGRRARALSTSFAWPRGSRGAQAKVRVQVAIAILQGDR